MTCRQPNDVEGGSSAFPDGRGSWAKADRHRDVDVRFRKGGGITPDPAFRLAKEQTFVSIG